MMPRPRFNDDEVRQIRKEWNGWRSYREIAQVHGVSITTIHHVIRRRAPYGQAVAKGGVKR